MRKETNSGTNRNVIKLPKQFLRVHPQFLVNDGSNVFVWQLRSSIEHLSECVIGLRENSDLDSDRLSCFDVEASVIVV